jgi:hypothetical protein
MVRTAHLAATTVFASLAFAPSAFAQGELLNDFQGDGQINPCAYSPGQLQNGLNNLPPDVQQYAPGFADQLRAALEAQCGGGAVPAPDTEEIVPGPVAPTAKTRFPRPPAPQPVSRQLIGDAPAPSVAASPGGSDVPDGLLPLIAAGGALLLLAIGGGLRLAGLGFGERLTGPLRASFSDMSGRTADALAYARDVFRFGR